MRSWSMLSTLALAWILAAAPTYANDQSVKAKAPEDRTGFPYGVAVTQADKQDAMRPGSRR